MKRKAMIIVLATIVEDMDALLLEGCHERNKRLLAKKELEFHMPTPIDTSAMEEEFYSRMWEFEAFYPSSSSDK